MSYHTLLLIALESDTEDPPAQYDYNRDTSELILKCKTNMMYQSTFFAPKESETMMSAAAQPSIAKINEALEGYFADRPEGPTPECPDCRTQMTFFSKFRTEPTKWHCDRCLGWFQGDPPVRRR